MKTRYNRSLLLLIILIIPSFIIGLNPPINGLNQQALNSYHSLAHPSSSWLNQTQVFDMLALPPNRVQAFHITVNGLWNGFFVEGENLSGPFEFGKY